MLKVRIIPTLLYKDSTLVKGKSYESWRRVGSLMQAIKVYNLRQVDELIFLDITATDDNRRPDFQLIDEFADECFMPLCIGGGIRSVDDVKSLLSVGADKISLSTASVERPDLVSKIAHRFGSQCVVVSIDVKSHKDGFYEVYTHSGKEATSIEPDLFAQKMEEEGAGEILLNSIDRDGQMIGYDLELIKRITTSVKIPVIASGGASCYNDFLYAILDSKASAVAGASIFHFTHQTPLEAKMFLKQNGINVRI